MPWRDGTGPMTGRGFGPCGFGAQRWFGRCYGRGLGWQLTKEEEKKILEAELREMELERKDIEKRLKELG